MKRKVYFVSLIMALLASLGCCVLLLSIPACGQPQQSSLAAEENVFNYQKDWYSQADQIMDYYNFPRDIAWEDNVLNPDNYEYLTATLYDIELNNPLEIDCIELQYLFIERYLGTCHADTEEWYWWYKEYKGY